MEPLTSSLPESPVRPLAARDNDLPQPTTATASMISCELLQDADPDGSSLKTSPDCSTHPSNPEPAEVHSLETYSGSFPKSGTWGNGWFSEQPSLDCPTIESDCLSLPTPTALSSRNSRPPGQNKLEVKLKELGLIQRGEVANPELLEAMFGLPMGYSSPVVSKVETPPLADAEKHLEIPSVENVRSQPSKESSTSTHSAKSVKEPSGKYSSITSATLKAISLWQPWASLIPLGLKHYETRSWKTNYRGKLLICSTLNNPKHYREYLKIKDELQLPTWDETNFPHGQAIALCELVDCIQMTPEFIAQQSQTEILCGDWQVGRYAWKLENIQPITEPFAVKGKQGLFNIPLTTILLISPSTRVSNDNQVLGGNISPSISPSTQVQGDDQVQEGSLLLTIPDATEVSGNNQVLGGSLLPSISPSTQEQADSQTQASRLLLSIPSNTQVSNDNQVLGGNPSLSISPSTQEQADSQTQASSLLLSIPSNAQVSNDNQVLGGNLLPSISPSTHRKHGEGSGNLSWGYANANSTKKKPIKQLYFEWEYGGMRGKTYVRSHLKERVIALNEAKVPVTDILELLTYNPKVKRVLGLN